MARFIDSLLLVMRAPLNLLKVFVHRPPVLASPGRVLRQRHYIVRIPEHSVYRVVSADVADITVGEERRPLGGRVERVALPAVDDDQGYSE